MHQTKVDFAKLKVVCSVAVKLFATSVRKFSLRAINCLTYMAVEMVRRERARTTKIKEK